MDPSYENIVDTQDMIWTAVAYLLHGGTVFVQASVACFLLGTGARSLLVPRLDGVWLRRLGATGPGGPRTRLLGAVRLALGLLLFAPLAMGAPMGASLGAGSAAFCLLLVAERHGSADERMRGRFMRRTAIGFAAIASLFILWEGEDNLSLGADLLLHTIEWRNEELAWQHALDPESPKIGDLAPDFELQDPDGEVHIRLSDFRGKRPVALIFGSYT